MSLWGKTDALASVPKYIARTAGFTSAKIDAGADTIDISLSGTGFNTGDEVVYAGNATTAGTYYIRVAAAGVVSLYDTYAHAVAGGATGLTDLAAGSGSHTLQRTGVAGDITAGGDQIVFVDAQEAQVADNKAKGITGAGWWRYITYTDAQSTTRHKAECLIAMSVDADVAGDAEDVIAEDLVVSIAVQDDIQDVTVDTGTGVVFTITATVNGDATLSYQWQVDTGGGMADIDGATSSSLTVSPSSDLYVTGNDFQVVISAGGGVTTTSSVATLTINP